MKGYLIRQHERCIQVLDAIGEFKKRKERNSDNYKQVKNLLPDLAQKYYNYALIINKCIERMELLYDKEKSKL